ncbi:DNA phosphorothioation system sulfurtransferase DndC [Kyrpidia spormannii]|uniref:DNA phosphorothioation system sulfurtransferase DndC n=1 Tax=Kyrpidia spormannii TaxID=2055160 RepID=UPI0018E406E5|nr:DNA phosphorothioation system sulfurtransferase DndC [Kyrpidia spormannii]
MKLQIRITRQILDELKKSIQELYLSDYIPWVVGYSGGKDSTATLQLVWTAIADLSPEKRSQKEIHVISTDTLVEQPIVAAWVNRSLTLMKVAATQQKMPIKVHRLTPDVHNSYWVNLIGRGYPVPRQGFRWCTSRLKIDPSNKFIRNMVKKYGETILVLGTRKSESSARAATMAKYETKRTRQVLSPNGSLQNSWVFSPIEDWSSDDVWLYLMQVNNPWGISNKDLMSMYREASSDNECPLVVDNTTPSCGNSRFGCWVCTLVSQDKSMEAMIQNDEEKIWMTPMLEFRNEIGKLDENGKIDDHSFRDFRRMDGSIKLYESREGTIPGPYTKEYREYLLRRLLEVEKQVQALMPSYIGEFQLVTLDELREIRRIWVEEKFEFDDAVPRIYSEVTGRVWPENTILSNFGQEEWSILTEITEGDSIEREMCSSLLMLTEKHTLLNRKKNIIDDIEHFIRKCYYADVEDALEYKKQQTNLRNGSSEHIARRLK